MVLENKDIKCLGKLEGDILEQLEDNYDSIFYNDKHCINKDSVLKKSETHSLQLVTAEMLILNIKSSDKLVADIKYKGKWYSNVDITDDAFVRRNYDKVKAFDGLMLNMIKIVVSLGEAYRGYHYKFIASIFEKSEDEIMPDDCGFSSVNEAYDYWYNDEWDED
ncbi:MAG: hypothetical protein JJE03_06900 [Peptostreptococcaceae bacterium]|nr:hypothetical protein [Peptostreptococcaceae bacterium]